MTSINASASIQPDGTVSAAVTGVYDPAVPVGDSVDMNRNAISFDATVQGPGADQAASSQAVIAKASTDSLVENNIQKATYKTNQADITFDAAVLNAMSKASGDVSLGVAVNQDGNGITTVTLTLQTVGPNPVEIIPESSKDQNGTVTVCIPYKLAEGKAVEVYYVSGQHREKVDATYDSATKTVTFTTKHFSDYELTEVAESCPHEYRNYTSNNDATCEHDGTETALCALCGKVTDTRTVPGSTLQHAYTSYQPYETATCQKDATEKAVCDICHKATDVRSVKGTKKPHSFRNYASNHDATCTQDGTKTAVCDVCGAKDTKPDVGSKLGHTYKDMECIRCGLLKTGCDGKTDCPTKNYTDVKKDAWYHTQGYVDYVVTRGVMTGTGTNPLRFEPDEKVTRAQMVETLWKMEGKPKITAAEADKAASAFTDVNRDAWYTGSIYWAYTKGLAEGMGDQKFAPDDSMTREQMVTFLYRYAKFKGADVTARRAPDPVL